MATTVSHSSSTASSAPSWTVRSRPSPVEPVALYELLTGTFRTHVANEPVTAGTALSCSACAQPWPCPRLRLAFRLREGF